MRSKKEIAKRIVLFFMGTFFTALGVAFTKHGGLGVSPLSSVPDVVSIRFTALTLGNWLTIWNGMIVLAQIVILRKRFKPVQLLQIPMAIVFGWCTDFGVWLVSPIPAEIYPARLLMVLIGIIVIAFGINLSVTADLILNCGEALIKAIADTWGKKFGNVKTCFDIFCVSFSITLSLIFFDFHIMGTREGTIISALFTGSFVKFFNRHLSPKIEKLLK